MRQLVAGLAVLVALVEASGAGAKDFGPGDVRLCDARHCAAIKDPELLRALSSFIYGDAGPRLAGTPRRGAPVLQLRFRNGYVAGLVGSPQLDRFRSHGVICGRFKRGSWYRLPKTTAHDLRRLAGTRLTPFAFTGRVPRSC